MRYRGPLTDHFDGSHFHNLENPHPRGFIDLLRWALSREPGPWQQWTDSVPGPPPPSRVDNGRLRVTFVNHSTVLLQMDGVNFLTDPIWSARASPVTWAGPRRHRQPGLRFQDLPPIDAVLLSHNHYDHLDLHSLMRLAREHSPRVIVPLGNRDYLESRKVTVAAELDWWQSVDVPADASGVLNLRVTSVPAKHFSGRGFRDRDTTLWCGYVIEGPSGAVYFAGDTGRGRHFEQIAGRFGSIRLAFLPIGAYRPRWFMSPVHMSPEEAVHAHQILKAGTSVGIHFGTFRLADDGQQEPAKELHRELGRVGIADSRFWVLGFGEGRDIPLLVSS